MRKNIELLINGKEEIVTIEVQIEKVQIFPKVEFVNKKLYPTDFEKRYNPNISVEINLILYIIINNNSLPLKFMVILERFEDALTLTHDDDFDYEPLYRKKILLTEFGFNPRDYDYTFQISELSKLILSQNSTDELIENQIYNFNNDNILINFNSYKDFEYGIYTGEASNHHYFQENEIKVIDEMKIYILPINYNVSYFKNKEDRGKEELLIYVNKGKLLKEGKIQNIIEVFHNHIKLDRIIKRYLASPNKMNKNKSNYDPDFYKRMTDWSNYNDDLDADQQSEDFWNQF